MSIEESKREFKAYLSRLYGSQKAMADALEVTPNTITNWVHRNPMPMLAHAPRLITQCDTTEVELFAEVMYHKQQLIRESVAKAVGGET